MSSYDRQVFLNVPFDARYKKLLRALVFSVHECGLVARCAQEKDDGGQVRVDKLLRIILRCRFGIHDLSRTTLDAQNRLPRFNMPLELGLFLGARNFGAQEQRRKACLILDIGPRSVPIPDLLFRHRRPRHPRPFERGQPGPYPIGRSHWLP